MDYKVNKKETFYFSLKIIFTILLLIWVGRTIHYFSYFAYLSAYDEGSMVAITIISLYILILLAILFFHKVYLTAYMKGNGICISESQFPKIYKEYVEMAGKLNIKKIPKLFLLQKGGILNSYVTRFLGKNYIAISSDIFSIYETDRNAVKFILAHELGHIKRMHISKKFWTFPSLIIPFLNKAYTRACKYTCDNIGISMINNDGVNGLLLLAGGKDLYKKIDAETYIYEAEKNKTFLVSLMQVFMSNPYLPDRVLNIITKIKN